MDSDEDLFEEDHEGSTAESPENITSEVNTALADAGLYEGGDVEGATAKSPSRKRKREYTSGEILKLIKSQPRENCAKAAEVLVNSLLKYPEDHPKGPSAEAKDKLTNTIAKKVRDLWNNRRQIKRKKEVGKTFISTEDHEMFATQPSQELSQGSDLTVQEEELLMEVDSLEIDDALPPPAKKQKTTKSGKPRKHFTELGVKQRRKVLNDLKTTPGLGISEQLTLWANQVDISTNQFHGVMMNNENRTGENQDHEVARVGMALFRNEDLKPSIHGTDVEEAVFLLERGHVGRETYNMQRFLLYDRFRFTPMYLCDIFRKNMRPPTYRNDVPEGELRGFLGGPRYVLKDAVSITIREHLQVNSQAEEPIPYGEELEISFSYGYDGAGQHSVYNMANQSGSVILSSYNLRTIMDKESGVKIWDCSWRRGHNSMFNTRPIGLIPQAEDPAIMKEFLQGTDRAPGVPGLEAEVKELMAGFTVDLPAPMNRTIRVTLPKEKVKCTCDQKMKKMQTGLQGAHCTLCTYSPKDCRDPMLIKTGFPINRTMEEIRRVFELKGDPVTGMIPKSARRTGDYDGGAVPRAGVTAEPITEFDLIPHVAVMHIKIHCMDYLAEVLYRILAGINMWINPLTPGYPRGYGDENNAILAQKKALVKDFIEKEMHITLFQANNQATGPMFHMFAKDANRKKLAQLIDDEEVREAYTNIHQQLCALTLVANSQRHEVDVDYFRMISINCYLELVETFKWIQIPETIHQLLAHMPELIENNDNIGLGGWSEEGLERLQGSTKKLRRDAARKTNTYDNLLDVLNHLQQQSSGLWNKMDEKRRRRERKKRVVPVGQDGLKSLVALMFVDHSLDLDLAQNID